MKPRVKVEGFGRHLAEWLAQVDTGSIDQDVDVRARAGEFFGHCADGMRVDQVTDTAARSNAFGCEFCRRLLQVGGPARDEDNGGASEAERAGYGQADAGVAAGDKRRASVEREQVRQSVHDVTGLPRSKLWPG